ncbi:SapC family protein [Pseudoxanthomonas sp.]|uniref:SapC family protein n=1 Tax=Pseudoxanthomonas sp. TaxID=1871049 RepID=UPI0026182D5E|nr:SapC family protein [Pseudoxanthomonas sp.]WDS34910.1 MAG: SapC family protein [Pseudoxanthomonas sp.]
MPRHALLNNIDHRDLRVSTRRGAGLGDEVMSVVTFPGEFRALQAYYPIVFQKDGQGVFHPLALLGLQPGQNVFLRGDGWDAHYLPLAIERQPFAIGHDAQGEPLLHVDLDHPRIDPAGEPLFLEHGGHTPLLQHIASVLRTLHEGLAGNAAFIDALLAHALLESFVLDIKLSGGQSGRLTGCYTIHEERLRALDAVALHALSQAGYLEPIFMAVASMAHLRDLIGRMEHAHAVAG